MLPRRSPANDYRHTTPLLELLEDRVVPSTVPFVDYPADRGEPIRAAAVPIPVLTATGSNSGPGEVFVYQADGTEVGHFTVFNQAGYNGGARVALGDFNG